MYDMDNEEYASTGEYEDDHTDDFWKDAFPSKLKASQLVRAASEGLADKVNLLIGSGHSVTGDIGGGALFRAATKGHAPVVASLLAAGAPVHGLEGSRGKTPIMKAAEKGHSKVVDLLLAAGASYPCGMTPLCYAAKNGRAAVTSALLAAGSPIEAGGDSRAKISPLMLAADGGYVKVVELLLAAGANVAATDRHNRTALIHAVEGSRDLAVPKLLEFGADVNVRDRTGRFLLFLAARQNNVALLKFLISAGADVHLERHVDPSSPPELLERSGSRRFDKTPLIAAARRGHVGAVKALLKAGEHIDVRGYNDNTALYFAIECGHLETVRTLIKAGASLEGGLEGEGCTPLYRYSPLYTAVDRRHWDVVRELLAAGADPNDGRYLFDKQPDGSLARAWCRYISPFILVSINGDGEIVRMLLEAGADADILDNSGCSALLHAVTNGHIDVVAILLAAGAELVNVNSLVFLEEGIYEMLAKEYCRRVAAVVTVLPSTLPVPIRQYIISLAITIQD